MDGRRCGQEEVYLFFFDFLDGEVSAATGHFGTFEGLLVGGEVELIGRTWAYFILAPYHISIHIVESRHTESRIGKLHKIRRIQFIDPSSLPLGESR